MNVNNNYPALKGRRSGMIVQLADGRQCIMYNEQPLKKKQIVVLNLIDGNGDLALDENNKPRTILKSFEQWSAECENKIHKLIGFVD